MEPESSPPRVPSELDPGGVLEHRVQMMDRGSIQQFMSQVREQALGVLDFKRQWKESEEACARMEKTVRGHVREVKMKEEECEIKQSLESDVMRLVLEMQMEEVVAELKESMAEKGEELKKEVQAKKEELEAREKELGLTITEKANELKKKEEEFELKQDEEARDIEEKRKSLEVKEKSFEEMMRELEVRKQELEARHKDLSLTNTEKSKELKKKEEELQLKPDEEARDIEEKRKSLEVKEKSSEEELMRELQVRKQELEERHKDLSLTITEKSNELKKKEEDIQVKQDAETRDIEEKRKSLEVKEKNFEEQMRELEVRKQEVEARQKELSLDYETFKGKVTEMEKRNEKQEAEAKEIEEKSKFLELKEKQLEQREELLELKEKELANRSKQAKSRKRCRYEFEPSSLPEKDVSASTSQAKRRKTHEVACIDDGPDEDPQPYCCPDADFNNFNTTMRSFAVGQIWALYDPLDDMPRYYARIRKILEPKLRVGVRWLESKQTTSNKKPVPIACGEFKYGEKATNSHLMFSHEMHHVRTGKKTITINPRKGETWALFSGWNSDNWKQQKRPYEYDFVQVVSDDLDSDGGIGVAYLGRVEGYTSVYKLAEQHGVLQMMIGSGEMLRFSHRVPSFELTGDEKKGVPAGSFELDPAAIPKHCLEALKVKQERECRP